jgi:hypothetical protein
MIYDDRITVASLHLLVFGELGFLFLFSRVNSCSSVVYSCNLRLLVFSLRRLLWISALLSFAVVKLC